MDGGIDKGTQTKEQGHRDGLNLGIHTSSDFVSSPRRPTPVRKVFLRVNVLSPLYKWSKQGLGFLFPDSRCQTVLG